MFNPLDCTDNMKSVSLLVVGAWFLPLAVEAVSRSQSLRQGILSSSKAHYEFEGPAGVGLPIHETITTKAAIDAGYKNSAASSKTMSGGDNANWPTGRFDRFYNKEYADLTRGAVWPDDPSGLLFNADEQNNNLRWHASTDWVRYLKTESWGTGACTSTPDALTCRSHFGSLSFIHAQTPANGVPASDVLEKMLEMAHFLVECATERLAGSSTVSSVATKFPKVAAGIGPTDSAKTLDALFGNPSGFWSTPHRCAGALAHMIEDSFSASHTRRLCKDQTGFPDQTEFGMIVEFTGYGAQEAGLHGKKDVWSINSLNDFTNLKEKLDSVPGANDGMTHVTEVFKKIKAKATWSSMEPYFKRSVWKLAPATHPSSSGGFHPGATLSDQANCVHSCYRHKPSAVTSNRLIKINKIRCLDKQESGSDHVTLVAICDGTETTLTDWDGAEPPTIHDINKELTCKKLSLRLNEVDPVYDDNLGTKGVDLSCTGTSIIAFQGGALGDGHHYAVNVKVGFPTVQTP